MTVHEVGCSPQPIEAAGPFIPNGKIATGHLARLAIVYVRQSSPDSHVSSLT